MWWGETKSGSGSCWEVMLEGDGRWCHRSGGVELVDHASPLTMAWSG